MRRRTAAAKERGGSASRVGANYRHRLTCDP